MTLLDFCIATVQMDESHIICPCVVIHKASLSMTWRKKETATKEAIEYDPDMCIKYLS